jgi:hypothetical protein
VSPFTAPFSSFDTTSVTTVHASFDSISAAKSLHDMRAITFHTSSLAVDSPAVEPHQLCNVAIRDVDQAPPTVLRL